MIRATLPIEHEIVGTICLIMEGGGVSYNFKTWKKFVPNTIAKKQTDLCPFHPQ